MEPIYVVVALGLVGGLLSAIYLIKRPTHSSDVLAAEASGRRTLDPPTINYSNLNVQGVGGLGLVAVCVAISIALPEIGFSMLAAVVLGALVAAVLVIWRRRQPLPSGGSGPAARSTFRFDSREDADAAAPPSWLELSIVALRGRASARRPVPAQP